MSARNLTLVDFISLMEKQSGRFKEDQVSDFRGERKFIGVMQTRCSSTCPIFALQKFKFNMNQPGTRLCSGGKRQKTRRNSKNKNTRRGNRAERWTGKGSGRSSFLLVEGSSGLTRYFVVRGDFLSLSLLLLSRLENWRKTQLFCLRLLVQPCFDRKCIANFVEPFGKKGKMTRGKNLRK